MSEKQNRPEWPILLVPWVVGIPTVLLAFSGAPLRFAAQLPPPFNALEKLIHPELAIPSILALTWICGAGWCYRRTLRKRPYDDPVLKSVVIGFVLTLAQACLACGLVFIGCVVILIVHD